MNHGVMVFFEEHAPKVDGRVLEVGAYDVNGSLKQLFPQAIGVDIRPGRGVDVVCNAKDLVKEFGAESFDTVISAETFEHIEDWRGATRGMWDVLKPGGWLVVSMASLKKGYHDYPHDYWRMDETHILAIWPEADIDLAVSRVSIGWAVQKNGPLPDIEAIELIHIDDVGKAA